jgi:glycerophosphoryl diester phosphodiesterase
MGASACNPKVMTWDYDRTAELQREGVAFNVWTVNDELTMRALIKTGVSGIITDYPQLLAGILAER